MNDSMKANLQDSLNLLLDIITNLNKNDIKIVKTRIKEYGYIADPKFIYKLITDLNREEQI